MMHEKRKYWHHLLLMVFTMLLVSACSDATAAETTPTSLPTGTSLPPTSIPTHTQSPSPVPLTATSIPQPTITPASSVGVESHPLALDENAATQMKLLNRFGTGHATDVMWSPNGEILAIATSSGVYLHDGHTFEEIGFIEGSKNVTRIAFSPDTKHIAFFIGSSLVIWDVKSGESTIKVESGIGSNVLKVVYGGGGHIAAIARSCTSCHDPEFDIGVWDSNSGELIYFTKSYANATRGLDISADGNTLIFLGTYSIYAVDLKDPIEVVAYKDLPGIEEIQPQEVIIAPDNDQVFISKDPFFGSQPPACYLVSLSAGTVEEFLPTIGCRGMTSNGDAAVFYGDNETVIFDLVAWKIVDSLRSFGPSDRVLVNADGSLVAAMYGVKILVFEAASDTEMYTFEFYVINAIDVGMKQGANENQYIAATSYYNYIYIWDLITGEQIDGMQVSEVQIESLAFSPDQRTLATLDDWGVIRLIDVDSFSITRTYDLHGLTNDEFAFDPDGLEIALLYGTPPDIYTLNLQSEELVLKRHDNSIYKFIFSNNGELISWNWGPDYLSVVNLDRNSAIRFPYDLVSRDATPEVMALSPDGRFIVFGLDRSAMLVGETDKLEFIHELDGHTIQGGDGGFGTYRDLKFNPVSNIMVSIGWDDTTRLWNVESGIELKRFDICCYATFTPDGRFLVTGAYDLIQVWGVPPLP